MEGSLDQIAEGKLDWERYLISWNRDYLMPALGKAREALKGVKGKGRGRPSSNSGGGSSFDANDPKLVAARARALKLGVLPRCEKGHGDLEPRLSKKGAVYWKCAKAGCECFAWNQEFSEHSCPECGQAMEKVPSKKVAGGYFLKCGRKNAHTSKGGEVVMFKGRQSGEWERPGR
jgi:DNA topoisomerase-1